MFSPDNSLFQKSTSTETIDPQRNMTHFLNPRGKSITVSHLPALWTPRQFRDNPGPELSLQERGSQYQKVCYTCTGWWKLLSRVPPLISLHFPPGVHLITVRSPGWKSEQSRLRGHPLNQSYKLRKKIKSSTSSYQLDALGLTDWLWSCLWVVCRARSACGVGSGQEVG